MRVNYILMANDIAVKNELVDKAVDSTTEVIIGMPMNMRPRDLYVSDSGLDKATVNYVVGRFREGFRGRRVRVSTDNVQGAYPFQLNLLLAQQAQ